ncbi:MFS transporter [Jiangella endophytica]|uniref:MFS transporter n=1 Tax=Jiangella endophytica TaxID=1623398 RepID=UPI000E348DBB|nr:MFS transporter [Jiangella endophytica]
MASSSRARTATASADAVDRPNWTPVVALAAGIAILVASEFLPASVLPALAADVGVSEGVAGLAVAATAIAGAVTAPSIAVVLPRTDRRTVLVGLLIVGAVANLAVAVAPNFAVLLAGRLLLGVAIAGFWSFAFGAGLHAMGGRDRAVSSAIAFGVSLATVVGVPVGAVVGDSVGWRAAFAGAAVLGVLTAAGIARALPSVPAHPTAGIRMLREALRHRRLLAGIGCVVLVAFGNFAAYPYIRVATEELDPGSATWLLLAWGVGGVAGTVIAGAAAVRLRLLTATAPVLLGVSLLVAGTADSLPLLTVAIVLWGLAFNMVPVATQLWVTRVEPERVESAMSLQVTAFQVAITIGSAAGGALLDAYGVGLPFIVGAAAAVAAGLGFASLRIPSR